MKCIKCNRERGQGQEYEYYYGDREVKPVQGVGFGARRTYYHIKGHRSEWICDLCVNWRSGLSISLFITFLMAISLVLYLSSQARLSNPFTLQLVLVGYALCVLILPPGRKKTWGEYIALNINKKTLKQQGYTAFLTGSQVERLKKKKDPLGE
jgi:hypothetical protein